jgi:hypothetical protein
MVRNAVGQRTWSTISTLNWPLKTIPTSLCHEKNVIDLQVCGAGPSALLQTKAAAPAMNPDAPTATSARLGFCYVVVEINSPASEASANRQLVLNAWAVRLSASRLSPRTWEIVERARNVSWKTYHLSNRFVAA